MCVICDHTSVTDINADLRNGVKLLQIENRYGVARASLHRHRDGGHHLSSAEMEVYSTLSGVDTAPVAFPVEETFDEESGLSPIAEAATTQEVQRPVYVAEPEVDTVQLEPVPEFTMAPYAPAEQPAPKPEHPERRAWRFNPVYTAEWADQIRFHLELMGWPEVALTNKTLGGSAEAWLAYFDALRTAGANLGERQQLERRVRYAEAVQYAEQDGEPVPVDPDTPTVTVMYASPERMHLGE